MVHTFCVKENVQEDNFENDNYKAVGSGEVGKTKMTIFNVNKKFLENNQK